MNNKYQFNYNKILITASLILKMGILFNIKIKCEINYNWLRKFILKFKITQMEI